MTIDQDLELANAAIAALSRIVDTVRGARLGRIDPGEALARLRSFDEQLAANNAAADAELEKKFPKE